MSALLDRLVAAVPALPRPLILLEDGLGRSGTARLAWGATRRHQVAWTDAAVGAGLGTLPPGRLYGVLAYDLGLPPTAARRAPPLPQPLADLFVPAHEVVIDLARDRVVSGVVPDRSPVSSPSAGAGAVLEGRSLDEAGFRRAIAAIKAFIAAGDVYQVNLAVAEWYRTAADAWTLYRRLRARNPSPWMGFADFGEWQLVSGSPELLLEVAEGRARTRPIAGTRKKTGDARADAAMRAELALDAKERAEHRMLLDLARNDLGRVAAFGTVAVAEREAIEEYAHVFHLVSEVRARLASGVTPAGAVAALFPGGTITGAPKRRAMEVIAQLEPVARGAYTGALGWIDAEGAQFNIVIRSLAVRGRMALVQAGSGIVWDSDPAREWREAMRKGQALREVLGA